MQIFVYLLATTLLFTSVNEFKVWESKNVLTINKIIVKDNTETIKAIML